MKEHEEERIAREKRRQLQIEQRLAEPKNEEKDNIDKKDELENAKKENNDQGEQKAANSDSGNSDGSEKLANLEDNRGEMESNQQGEAEAERKTEEHKSETESATDSEKATGIADESVISENLLKETVPETLKDAPGRDDRATKDSELKQDGSETVNREDNQKAESTNQLPPSEQAASSEEKLPVEAAVHDQKAKNENVENIELEHTNLNGADISTQDQQKLPQRTEGSQETVDEGKISLEATDLVNSNADAEPTSEDHKAEDKPETQPLEGDQINVEIQVPVNSEDSREVNTNENIDGKTVDESVNTEATKDILSENNFPDNANAIEQHIMPQANQEKEVQNSDHSAEEGTNEHAANQETEKNPQHIKHSSEEM